MYIAGLNLSFTESQTLNGIACLSFAGSLYIASPKSDFKKRIEEKAGKVVHMPASKRGEIITAAHGFVMFTPAVVFLTATPFNKFVQPGWLAEYTLPNVPSSLYYATRIGCAVAIWISGAIVKSCMKHLDAQWNYIGVRERPEIVKTGPYRFVRHPMYSTVMLTMGGMAGAFWNWIPVPAAGLLAILFAIKMPMEENVMLGHEYIGPKYVAYKKEVPYRVIPYIW
ncbi:putative transmembrane protein [Rhizoctonia solani AG-1 IB]|uniref:Putative transmembrane protein n=1 Tax=Thanatephorus cucumeris (strain AG1-IB / isolate 7/3/14) TaxID=1108050 RepID=M5BQ73_THACB|nr:putative transmembrane protein [Rhizoctonia solani AG-1 IB]